MAIFEDFLLFAQNLKTTLPKSYAAGPIFIDVKSQLKNTLVIWSHRYKDKQLIFGPENISVNNWSNWRGILEGLRRGPTVSQFFMRKFRFSPFIFLLKTAKLFLHFYSVNRRTLFKFLKFWEILISSKHFL